MKKKNFFTTFVEYMKISPKLFWGIVCFCVILLLAVMAPLLAGYSPYYLSDELLVPPLSAGHLLGTTYMGEDVWSMILYGGRTSLKVGIVAAALSGLIGVLLGAAAGYFGGIADKILTEITNIFLMIPSFFLILIVVAMFGSSMFNVMVIIALTSWPSNARMMRTQVMSLKERTYVKSAQTIGESGARILFHYIVPNGIYPIIANTTMNVAQAILTEAGLSFLGLGDPNQVSWGQMIMGGKSYLVNGWWISLFAGLAIILVVIVFYMIGDGLNYAMNPKMQGRK
ncbi:MAG: ABC transporter permease [Roseburia sp.]|jgi:peptide/nickel transport system permease protein|nr:ABC transporter permease [Roseburia sp.]